MKQKILCLAVLAAMTIMIPSVSEALEPTVVTFDSGVDGWSAGPDCQTIMDSGNPDAGWNFKNSDCGTTWYPRSHFSVSNDTDPEFIGDFTNKGPVRISVDVNVNDYTYRSFFGSIAVEEYRQLVVEFIDHDNIYVDPDTGLSLPWTSVIYQMGYFQSRDAGWKTFTVDIEDPGATEVPAGWVGFGGPENTTTYLPQLPPNRTFADVLAGVDEIRFHTIEPGYFYAIAFTHDIDFDNITIKELPRTCSGYEATVWVDNDGIVHGGEQDGQIYAGTLVGTKGDDIIVGTNGDDTIQGLAGNDLICGRDGDDALHGHFGDDFVLGGNGDDTLTGLFGNDFLDGGEGRDNVNGGKGNDTCTGGEVFNNCGQ